MRTRKRVISVYRGTYGRYILYSKTLIKQKNTNFYSVFRGQNLTKLALYAHRVEASVPRASAKRLLCSSHSDRADIIFRCNFFVCRLQPRSQTDWCRKVGACLSIVWEKKKKFHILFLRSINNNKKNSTRNSIRFIIQPYTIILYS